MVRDSGTLLLSIIALARAGSLEHAWRMFRAAGLEGVSNDPAVLILHGRLLKARAVSAKGAEQRRLYLKAARAYARAGEIGGALYPLINAATLSMLGGRRDRARTLAQQVLDRGSRGEDEPDTPYWRAATQAEALLLLGEVAKAKREFKGAIALAPLAYEDHAISLRQFAMILDELGEDRAWLDTCRPPRSLHFAGHMALSSRGGKIERQIRAIIDKERIGFGYGALAAGADIVIAEALLEKSAKLHLILPTPVPLFRRASVVRFGHVWARRFDGVLESAASVRSVAKECDPHSPLAFRLTTEIAMGSAVMHADALMSEAVQLLILEKTASGAEPSGVSASAGAAWRAAGRRQYVIPAPRVRTAKGIPAARAAGPSQICLAAMLRIDLAAADPETLAAILPKLARLLSAQTAPMIAPRWTGEEIVAAYETAAQAAAAALSMAQALKSTPGPRIAGHYALVERAADPFGGGEILSGCEARTVREILHSTPPFAVHVSEDFAAALSSGPAADRPRVEYVGELPCAKIEAHPMRLYSLRR